MSADARRYFLMRTAPYGSLTQQVSIEWDYSQTPSGDQTGPFPAPHLKDIGIQVAGLGSGFRRGVPPEKIVFGESAAGPLRDFEPASSNWLVSGRALDILKGFAADAIDVVEPDVFVRAGDRDQKLANRWLCSVVRFEDAVDEGISKIVWETRTRQYAASGCRFVMKRDLSANVHLFRLAKRPSFVVCSGVLRDALVEAEVTGLILEHL